MKSKQYKMRGYIKHFSNVPQFSTFHSTDFRDISKDCKIYKAITVFSRLYFECQNLGMGVVTLQLVMQMYQCIFVSSSQIDLQ